MEDMSNQMRASDQDREQVVARLNEAVGKGLLTLPEAEERIAAAYKARYLDDLPPLTVDLPDPTPPKRSREHRPRFDPRLLVVVAALAAVIVVTHGWLIPLIPLVILAVKFGPWRYRHPARM